MPIYKRCDLKDYLDGTIKHWSDKSGEKAEHYVQALQMVRTTVFDEPLKVEETPE